MDPVRKRCRMCGFLKPEAQFYPDRQGVLGLTSYCRECTKLNSRQRQEENPGYHKAWRENRRRENRAWVDQLKSTTPCADCKRSWPAPCMDLVYKRPEDRPASNRVGHMITKPTSLRRLQAEVEKCEVVCACCGRLRHQEERSDDE